MRQAYGDSRPSRNTTSVPDVGSEANFSGKSATSDALATTGYLLEMIHISVPVI